MISLLAENRLSISALARQEGVNPSTVWRWIQRGTRGAKLETMQVGGRRFTTQEAFARFVEATTKAANGERPKPRTNRQRQTAIRRAEAKLDALGI